MMFKRMIAAGALTLLFSAGLPAVANAHELKIDGQISAVLHVEPDDDATTGAPTGYKVLFNDDSGRFSLQKCDCSLAIIQDDKVIANKKLAVSNDGSAGGQYTFTNPGNYTFRVTGTPIQPGAFQPFVLNYEEPVAPGAEPQYLPPVLWFGIGAGIGLILLVSFVTNYYGARRTVAEKPANSPQ